MGHTLVQTLSGTHAPRRYRVGDDPLGAARGILFGVMLSVLGFWLPLALLIAD